MKNIFMTAMCLGILSACGGNSDVEPAESIASEASAPALISGIDVSNIDSSVRPQDDLFRHINGKWLQEFVADSPQRYPSGIQPGWTPAGPDNVSESEV